MKKILIFLSFLILSISAYSQSSTFGSGLTPAQYYAKLNRLNYRYFDITDYGAVGDNSTPNATYIQAAIEAAHVNGGIVWVPIGTYLTRTLTTYNNVKIMGDGVGSILKSTNAEPLLTCTSLVFGAYGPIENITLQGNSVGTIGLYMRGFALFDIRNCSIGFFTTYGVELNGSLEGIFFNCFMGYNPISIYTVYDAVSSVACNFIDIKRCMFQHNTSYGIKITSGSLIKIEDTDFESNGAVADSTTGSVYYSDLNGGGGSAGILLDNCWFETNYGIDVYLDDNSVVWKQSTMRNNFFTTETVVHAVKIVGNIKPNTLYFMNNLVNDLASFIISGGSCTVYNNQSFVNGTIVRANGGTYTLH